MYIKSSATTRLVSHIQTPEFNLWEHWECVFLRQTDRERERERPTDRSFTEYPTKANAAV